MEQDHLQFLNQWVTAITQFVNALAGHAGEITLAGPLNLGGNKIKNVGPATDSTDVLTSAVASPIYGPAAIQPQLEALGKQVLQTARRLNDTTQREGYSTFMNDLVSTAPTTNTSQVAFGAPSGGTVAVTVSAGFFERVDSSRVSYASRTDFLTLPTAFTLTTLVRSGNVVTATTSGANTLAVGQTIHIVGASDPSFNGFFVVTAAGNPFTYNQQAPDASTSGGTASIGGVYYYFLGKGTNVLSLSTSPGTADTWSNRLQSSLDGQTIIAVVTVNGVGGVTTLSGAGATPPANTANVRLFGRL